MILKAFKEKSNQKFVEKTLANRKVFVNKNKIVSAGVLLNSVEYANYDEINKFLDDLNVVSAKRQFFMYSETHKQEFTTWENIFTKNDFGWKGSLKNQDLQKFTQTKFDVLICYFLGDCPELKQIAVMSKANLKVGISNQDERLYDLIIGTDTKDFKLFKVELKKYLSILNKL